MTTKKKAPPLDTSKTFKLDLSFDDFDLGELEDLVEFTGVDIMESNVKLDVKMLRVIAWILDRRENPARTLEECRGIKLSQFDIAGGSDPKE